MMKLYWIWHNNRWRLARKTTGVYDWELMKIEGNGSVHGWDIIEGPAAGEFNYSHAPKKPEFKV